MAEEDMQKIDISSRTIFRVLFIVAVFWFVYIIRDVLLLLFAAVILSAAIEPIANWFQQRRIPRAVGVLIVYGTVIAVVSITVTLLIPPLTQQITQLSQALPTLLSQLEQSQGVGRVVTTSPLTASLNTILKGIGDNLTRFGGNIFEQTRSFFSGLTSVLFVFILAFYLVVERHALKKVLRLVVPRRHSAYVEQTLDRVQRGIGRWVIAQLFLGFIIGTVVGSGLWLLGFNYALVLGLLAGVLEIIPVIGPLIAAIPAVVLGFSQSLLFGVITLIFYVVVQQLENHLLVPTIMRRATGLNPLVTIVAVLLGARLAGVMGIIVAVPIATIMAIFWSDLFLTDPLDEEVNADTNPLMSKRFRATLKRLGVLKPMRSR